EQGDYLFINVPAGSHRISVQFIGYGVAEQSVTVATGQTVRADFQLSTDAISLEAVVVTALGRTTQQRALGTAQQTVAGRDIAQSQKENFVNALQGRVAGLEVVSTSGVPGASSSI